MYYIYDQDSNKLNSNYKNLTFFDIGNFFKSIHLKGEIILLAYYDKDSQDDNWYIYIDFIELEMKNNNAEFKYIFNLELEKLILERYLMNNDMIKMDNNTIYLATMNSEKKYYI